MGVAAFHFIDHPPANPLDVETAVFGRNLSVKNHLQEEVTEFQSKFVAIPGIDGLGDLEGLLDRITPDGFVGLFLIPGAAARSAKGRQKLNQFIKCLHRRILHLLPGFGITTRTSMAEVVMYVTGYCPYCHAAKEFLADKGVSFTEIDVTGQPAERSALTLKAEGRSTVPQIFIGGRPIGGFDEMIALEREGALDPLLEAP